jgi:hypothetical protein
MAAQWDIWAISTRVDIRDNIDAIVSHHLQRASYWNGRAAMAACAAAIVSCVVLFLD